MVGNFAKCIPNLAQATVALRTLPSNTAKWICSKNYERLKE